MKPIPILIAGFFLGFTFLSYGHSTAKVKARSLSIDSLTKKELIDALNKFLVAKENPIDSNKFVLKEDLLDMSALADEMKGMDKNAKLKDGNFYRAYLTNIVDLNNNNFLIQFSYIGLNEKAPVLRASFKLMAKKQDTQFYFFSPLKQNTAWWKSKKIGNITFHFKDTLDEANAKLYVKTANFYDKKIKAPASSTEFYFCDNFPEVLQLLGIDYKSDYNGIRYDDISSHQNNTFLEVNGWYDESHRFDLHDLWHDRLHAVVSVDIINRSVDEGCAYLYGGSWGISWQDILTMFKKYASENPNADWGKLYRDNINFLEGARPLKIAYVINALIVKKIEKEKGFDPVMDLLTCGKREAGDDNYFRALEKVTGISKTNFNDAVWRLVHQ